MSAIASPPAAAATSAIVMALLVLVVFLITGLAIPVLPLYFHQEGAGEKTLFFASAPSRALRCNYPDASSAYVIARRVVPSTLREANRAAFRAAFLAPVHKSVPIVPSSRDRGRSK
jgi:uncharacterized membrane protein